MLTKPNFQELMNVCKATEEDVLQFNMAVTCNACGTAGCMIGNYNKKYGRPSETFGSEDRHTFNITRAEYHWLFYSHCVDYPYLGWIKLDFDAVHCILGGVPLMFARLGALHKVTKEQALRRLRLFIYYKLRKQEFIVDEKYGVREESRTKEGNHGFAQRALQEALAV